LQLQTDYQVSVSVLLTLIGMPLFGHRALAEDEMDSVLSRAEVWQTRIIEPLRSVRRQLKANAPAPIAASAEALRTAVLDNEIEAERHQQALLIADYCARINGSLDIAETPSDRATAFMASTLNAERYFTHIGAESAAGSGAYATLIEAFGEDVPGAS
jgi:uncharacterized protein (TIGR02444 family)